MYDNPNHYFRLRLMLEAIPDIASHRLVGVLRRSTDTSARQTLEAMGFREFIFLEEGSHHVDDFRDMARRKLRGVNSHADLLKVVLPDGMPAFIFYDTVLKVMRHPQPPLDSAAWEYHLAEVLRNMTIYRELFEQQHIAFVIFSHGWKNEYAPAIWTAIRRGVPAYHLTAYYETIRARLIANEEDYSSPMEQLQYDEFLALPGKVQTLIIEAGWQQLEERARGCTTDISERRAYRPEQRMSDRQSARTALGVMDDRPVGVVYAHAWYDFPHIFGLCNFTDFLDWMQVTLDAISHNNELVWLVKPHPLESWYGHFRLADVAKDLSPHVYVLPEQTDSLTVTIAADVAVTVHGTIGFEASARGVPVICADRNYYSDWPFSLTANSREDYVKLLANAHRLERPDASMRAAAAAFAYLVCAPHPPARNLIQLKCDSSGLVLYRDIVDRIRSHATDVDNEISALSEWLASETHSYSIHAKCGLFGCDQASTTNAMAARVGGKS